jgi:tetratricopeptide (TPR) repeat protein
MEAGRYEEAKAEVQRLIGMVDAGPGRALLLALAVLTGDAAKEDEQRTWMRTNGDPTETRQMLMGAAIYRGQLREAERQVDEIHRAYTAAGVAKAASGSHAAAATAFALYGATDRATALMARLPGDGSGDQTADERLIAAALAGDAATARRMLPAALEDARADDERKTTILRAMELVGRDDVAGALNMIGEVQLHPRDDDAVLVHSVLSARAKRWDAAIRDLEGYIPRSRRQLSANLPLARVTLAQAYEGAGRRDEARKAYADFVEFWKTADADVPILVEAKRALARLAS